MGGSGSSEGGVRYPRLNDVGLSLARPRTPLNPPLRGGRKGGWSLRDNRRSDSSPGDGARRIAISMRSMPARDTTKHGLSDAVPAFRMPTGAAALTGVCRINKHDRHTCQSRLVADELPHLREGPIAASRSFRFPYRRPRPPFSPPHNVGGIEGGEPLADAMVRILLKPALTTGQSAQTAFRRETAALLEPPAQVRVPAPFAFNGSSAPPRTPPLRGGGLGGRHRYPWQGSRCPGLRQARR